ncbi:hypothetical protein KC614_04305 [candidate division WWE3 bacterium]|uniref:Uncharacterized protein n=1 Tax=candidate division WWE3 bacterium TaxID=2053526 RepID=A0A955LKX4_UNCKA|nr:hypothetical protein [candidate division WWE3 bacterium]
MQGLSDDLKKIKDKIGNPDKNVSREFQIYGYELAEKLDDLAHKSLYIRLAKVTPRGILEKALSFVLDYPNAQSKAKLFMYKYKQLKNESGN